MDGKRVRKEGESHNFMEKFFTKLKMTKHTNEEKSTDSKKITPSSSTESKPLILWDSPKITAENMMQFSEQLHQLLENLQEMKEVMIYTYDYPNELNTKLEKEAMELKSLFRDVRAAAIDIERLRKQRQIVRKEKSMAQKRLEKLREEELKELESIISVYAKPLFCKWESIKNSQKAEVLENFMNEIMGKNTAMEILQELVKRKLSKLVKKQGTPSPFMMKRNISSTNMGNKMKNQERTTSSWNIATTQDALKTAAATSERSAKTEKDIIRVNRRKRQREIRDEKRRQNTDSTNNSNSTASEVNNAGLDLQLIPIDGLGNDELDDAIPTRTAATAASNGAARSPPVINVEYTSDDDSVSLSSSDFIIENLVHNTGPDMQADLQNEMRNVLQALFGEIRQIPQVGYGSRNRHNNSGNDLRSPRTASH